MKILITGGAGFQGSHLTESLLKNGHDVSVLNTYSESSRANLFPVLNAINLVWGDVSNRELVDESIAGHDLVFHLAGHINVDESLKDPLVFFNSNILGTYNVLEAVRKYKNRLVLVSSCEVYGDGDGEKLNEAAELKPNNPYAASKVAADRMAYSYFKSFDSNITIVRPFNIYGERQKSGLFGALIPILVARAMKGEDLVVFGDGKAERDYSHVSDMVEAYNIIINNNDLKGKTINLGNGKTAFVIDIAEYIAKKFHVKIVHGPARPGEVMRVPADIAFAESLGFSPKVSVWEGIDRYIKWAVTHQKL